MAFGQENSGRADLQPAVYIRVVELGENNPAKGRGWYREGKASLTYWIDKRKESSIRKHPRKTRNHLIIKIHCINFIFKGYLD